MQKVASARAMLPADSKQLKAGSEPGGKRPSKVRFQDLEAHRIIGTGQFGLVRVTRNVKTNEVYALKVGGGGGRRGESTASSGPGSLAWCASRGT